MALACHCQGSSLALQWGISLAVGKTPIYEASSKFVILRAPQTTYDYYAYLDNQQLISTYVQLLLPRAYYKKPRTSWVFRSIKVRQLPHP